MRHLKNAFFKISVVSILVVMFFTFPLISQHRTINDSIMSMSVPAKIRFLQINPAFSSQFFDLRVKVIRTLGKKGNDKAINILLKTLQEGNCRRYRYKNKEISYWKIRAASALALGRIGNKKVSNDLLVCIRTENDKFVKVSAVKALGLLGVIKKEKVAGMIDNIMTY